MWFKQHCESYFPVSVILKDVNVYVLYTYINTYMVIYVDTIFILEIISEIVSEGCHMLCLFFNLKSNKQEHWKKILINAHGLMEII